MQTYTIESGKKTEEKAAYMFQISQCKKQKLKIRPNKLDHKYEKSKQTELKSIQPSSSK